MNELDAAFFCSGVKNNKKSKKFLIYQYKYSSKILSRSCFSCFVDEYENLL